ncbi:hypothetical protein, partial [Xiamenia xianingshaonis]|uniref:hypothetical protein n=1 Tax=Xiamenia xianingshaonis TaxID=2682776 RepID=UPI0021BDA982
MIKAVTRCFVLDKAITRNTLLRLNCSIGHAGTRNDANSHHTRIGKAARKRRANGAFSEKNHEAPAASS